MAVKAVSALLSVCALHALSHCLTSRREQGADQRSKECQRASGGAQARTAGGKRAGQGKCGQSRTITDSFGIGNSRYEKKQEGNCSPFLFFVIVVCLPLTKSCERTRVRAAVVLCRSAGGCTRYPP